jgi:hypothetical protein
LIDGTFRLFTLKPFHVVHCCLRASADRYCWKFLLEASLYLKAQLGSFFTAAKCKQHQPSNALSK